MSESYKVYASQEYVDHKFNDVSGLPSGSKPNQYIVTDGEGNAKWEDKLAWSEKSTKEILPETFVAEPSEQFDGFSIYPINCSIESGKKYTIIYNGVAYDVISVATDDGRVVFAGNLVFTGADADTGEPFLIASDALTGDTTAGTVDSGGITISIFEVAETVHKLSGKYVEGMGWSEKSTKEVLPETFVPEPAQQIEGLNAYFINCALEGGKKYTVIYNGVAYDVISHKPTTNGVVMGNTALAGQGDDTGEPFIVSYDSYSGETMVGTQDDGGITISIFEDAETVHTIDKKFLPSGGSHLRVFITMDENENYLSSHSYEEIKNHVLNGGTCDCAFGDSLFHLNRTTFLSDAQTYDLIYQVVFTNIESDTLTHVSIRANGRVYVERYALSLQEI